MIGCMEPIFEQLSGYRRIYIDLPGMGKSTNVEGITCSDDVLTVVIDTIKSILENTPFILVGESYGGYITRGIIEKMKSQILGACLLCPLIVPEPRFQVLLNDIVKQYDAAFLDTLSLKEKTMFTQLAIIANVNTYQRFKEEILPGIQCANHKDAVNVSSYYPRATVMILDMAGHNLQIEQPILFNALVKEWLQRVDLSKQGTDE